MAMFDPAEKREQFARTLVSRVLAYSLGRSLERSDRETVDTITAQFIKNDYKLQNLIRLIVTSDAFGSK